jgi:hypothetical protein
MGRLDLKSALTSDDSSRSFGWLELRLSAVIVCESGQSVGGQTVECD